MLQNIVVYLLFPDCFAGQG